jgi:alkylation response protein AidB-like acyl-CoA dehydrogenase
MRSTGLERMLRDARINRIVEGTSEVMTAFIALMGMKAVGEELEGVLRNAKHPVNNFGRLTEFARVRFGDVVIGHELEGLHPQLRAEGQTLARLTRRLARDVIRLLGMHREKILDLELLHQRVAGAVVELYAMAAVMSKLQQMLEARDNGGNGHESFRRDLIVGRSFCAHAAERVEQRLGGLFGNEDAQILRTADAVLGIITPSDGNGRPDRAAGQ